MRPQNHTIQSVTHQLTYGYVAVVSCDMNHILCLGHKGRLLVQQCHSATHNSRHLCAALYSCLNLNMRSHLLTLVAVLILAQAEQDTPSSDQAEIASHVISSK